MKPHYTENASFEQALNVFQKKSFKETMHSVTILKSKMEDFFSPVEHCILAFKNLSLLQTSVSLEKIFLSSNNLTAFLVQLFEGGHAGTCIICHVDHKLNISN